MSTKLGVTGVGRMGRSIQQGNIAPSTMSVTLPIIPEQSTGPICEAASIAARFDRGVWAEMKHRKRRSELAQEFRLRLSSAGTSNLSSHPSKGDTA